VKKETRQGFLSFSEQGGSVSLRAMTCPFKPGQIQRISPSSSSGRAPRQ